MNRSAILLVVAFFIAVAGGLFILFSLKTMDAPHAPVDIPLDTIANPGTEKPKITRIDAKHYYTVTPDGGVHTIAGELMMPSSCDLLNPNTVLLDDGKRAVVAFDVINNDPEGCDKTATPRRFKVGFRAEKDIKIEAVYLGNTVPLNLVEAGANESPADFELFIKG